MSGVAWALEARLKSVEVGTASWMKMLKARSLISRRAVNLYFTHDVP